MTDIQPPISNERAADAARLGAPSAHAPDSIPAIVQGQPRILYRYWAGAVALGLMMWIAIFLIF